MNSRRILVVDDDESLRRVTQVQLEEEGYLVATAQNAAEALHLLAKRPQDLVVTDLSMPGMSGVDLLRVIRSEYPETIVVLVTAFGTVENAVQAMKLGAYDYITKPVNPDNLRLTVDRALHHLSLRKHAHSLRHALDQRTGFEDVIGHSKALLSVLEQAGRAALSDVTVLIRGETGTGKELVAAGIHQASARRANPFVTINCGAIPAELLESELFGYVKGAFTGAVNPKQGRIETASCGTVFLDEIGDLPMGLQVKMLRLLQNREIAKVGSTATETVDVRIIAATHRDLKRMVAEGRFREDLYYRLTVVPIELPPLRQRSEDIPELVQHFLGRAKQRHSRENVKLSASLIGHLSSYEWPGNIRELENIVERLVVLASGDEITEADLPRALTERRSATDVLHIEMPPDKLNLDCLERDLLQQVLIKFDGNQTRAAHYLELSRKTLIYRMEKHGLRSERDG
jgi:two-component system NtrC family response regulator